MKRNLDLIREILLTLESMDFRNTVSDKLKIVGYDEAVITYHCQLLLDAGFILGKDVSTMGGVNVLINRMSNAGHDYLDAVREPSRWQSVKDKIISIGGSVTLDMAKEIAMTALKLKLGLS